MHNDDNKYLSVEASCDDIINRRRRFSRLLVFFSLFSREKTFWPSPAIISRQLIKCLDNIKNAQFMCKIFKDNCLLTSQTCNMIELHKAGKNTTRDSRSLAKKISFALINSVEWDSVQFVKCSDSVALDSYEKITSKNIAFHSIKQTVKKANLHNN